MSYKQVAILILIVLASASIGHFLTLHSNKIDDQNHTAPKVYVERCSFLFKGEHCGEQAKNVIFFSSDEFLGFTENWAVGRAGNYKMYMSCFGPGDDKYTDGTYSSLSVVVAGPNLLEAHEISKRLMVDFSNELSEQSESVAHCIEK